MRLPTIPAHKQRHGPALLAPLLLADVIDRRPDRGAVELGVRPHQLGAHEARELAHVRLVALINAVSRGHLRRPAGEHGVEAVGRRELERARARRQAEGG